MDITTKDICGMNLPISFFQLLAATLMKDSTGKILGFNFIIDCSNSDCECEPAIDCDHSHIPPETLLNYAFAEDACGHLAIKLVNCDGSADGCFEEEEQ